MWATCYGKLATSSKHLRPAVCCGSAAAADRRPQMLRGSQRHANFPVTSRRHVTDSLRGSWRQVATSCGAVAYKLATSREVAGELVLWNMDLSR